MFSGVAVALPALGAELGVGGTTLGLVETLFLAGSVTFLLPVGWLADAGDKRTLFKLGILFFGVSSILLGLTSYVPLILGLRFMQGVAASAFAATGPAILAEIVPAERRGSAYGGSLAATYSGLTLGPIVGGILVDRFGWRAVFFFGGACLLAAAALVQSMLRSRWQWPARPPNVPSVLLVFAAIMSGVLGSAAIEHSGWGGALIGASLVFAAGFVALQRRLERPLLDVDALFRNGVLRNALLVQLLLYMTAFSSTFMLSLFLQVSLDRTAQMAGRVLAISTVLMAVTAPIAGRLADRFRPAVISTLGVLSVLGSTVLGAQLDSAAPIVFVGCVLAAQGLGFGLFSSPNMTTIMGSVPPRALSMTSALASKARHVGMVSGMLLATTLVALAIGDAPVDQHPDEIATLISTAYTVLAGLNFAALAVAAGSMRRRRRSSGL